MAVEVSEVQMAYAFAEWERRYREDSRAFLTSWEKFQKSTRSYGESCASYFMELLLELR